MNQVVAQLSLEERVSNVVQEEQLLQVAVVLTETSGIVALVEDGDWLWLVVEEVIHEVVHAVALV